MDKSCWQWIDWTPCYALGDTSHGNKVELMGWCPVCGKMRLRSPGYGYNKPLAVLDTPHFEPDFRGMVEILCPSPGCGYQGTFFVDVPERKVLMVREVCSKEV